MAFDQQATLNADPLEVRRGIDLICGCSEWAQLFVATDKVKAAGLYDLQHRDQMVADAVRLNDGGYNVYVGINPVRDDARLAVQRPNEIGSGPRVKNEEVASRSWLCIDIDPMRSGALGQEQMATAEESQAAHECAQEVQRHLQSEGWPEPMTMFSGNGEYLLYRIDLANQSESDRFVKGVLEYLAGRFNIEGLVKIDRAVSDPTRSVRCPGTVNRKGPYAMDRPYRMAFIRGCDTALTTVALRQLQALLPKENTKAPHSLKRRSTSPTDASGGQSYVWDPSPPLDDDKVTTLLRGAANSKKFERLHDQGDCSGYASASEADLALIMILAFYTQRPEQLERLFRKSTLANREKSERDDYCKRTINKALSLLTETWQGDSQSWVKENFYAHLESHKYIHLPSGRLWPAASLNNHIRPWPTSGGAQISPSKWLDQHRKVDMMSWDPERPQIVDDELVLEGGWVPQLGAAVYNQYRPAPKLAGGDPAAAKPWLDHVRGVYPDDCEHIIRWLAFKVQRPGVKINHALVLGGPQGVGKDTILEPVKAAIGHWNFGEVSPAQMLGTFDGWVRNVIVRVSEARDQGADSNRFAFYEHSKTLIAAPPDVLRVNEKFVPEYPVVNVMGLIFTTNDHGGLYLPQDDRRHYVAFSPRCKEEFLPDYFINLYRWFNDGGNAHVAAYLRSLDLSGFDPKAPPPKTAAFWSMVKLGEASDAGDLRDLLEKLGNPAAITVRMIRDAAPCGSADPSPLVRELNNRRAVPAKLGDAGYIRVGNPDAKDGDFRVNGTRQSVYALRTLSDGQRLDAARVLAAKGYVLSEMLWLPPWLK